MKLWWITALALSAATAAFADAVSPAPDAVTVTIYHGDGYSTADLESGSDLTGEGLALITETREIDLPAGPSVIRFRGVASTMVPQSADIEGLPPGTIERNFDYDLLSPGSLLAKSIGETVHVIRTDPKTGKRTEIPAIIRGAPDGVMLDIGGKLEALHCAGLPESIVLDKAPDGLTDVPTLSVRTNAPAAGHYKVRLAYLATGLNWSADYVAHVRPGGRTLDLTGWLTLANFGTTGFARVPIQAVAGRLNVTGTDTPIYPTITTLARQCWPDDIRWWTRNLLGAKFKDLNFQSVPVAASEDRGLETVVVTGSRIDPRALGDYKLYALPEPTDMPARETKQVQFLDQHDVPFERVYVSDMTNTSGRDGTDPATLTLRLRNVADAGLGKALPSGNLAVTETGPDGTPFYIGQAEIEDTPVGLPLVLATGEAPSVQVGHRIVAETVVGPKGTQHRQITYEFEIANLRSEPVTAELTYILDNGQARVTAETEPHTMDRGAAVWRFTLKPGERAPLRLGLDIDLSY